MVTAELRYTTDSYLSTLVGPSTLDFDGEWDVKVVLANLAHLVTLDKYYKSNAIISCYKAQIKKNEQEIEKIKEKVKKQILSCKVIFVWGKNKEIIYKLRKHAGNLASLNYTMKKKIDELEDNLFYTVNEKKFIQKKLLNNLKFAIQKSYKVVDGDTFVEVFESTLSDNKLYEKAKEMYNKLKGEQEKEIEEIKNSFIKIDQDLTK